MSIFESRYISVAVAVMVAALLLGGGIFATTSTGLGRAVDGSLDSRSEPAPGALEDDSPASDGSTSEPTSEIESSSVGTLDDGSTVAALQLNTVAESAGDDETDTTTGFDAPPLVDSDLSAEPDESSLSDTDAVATPTPTPEATASPAAIATATATPSPSPVPAAEMIETPTPTPTQQPTQTPVLLPTATATAAPTPSATPTATPTEEPPPPPPPPPADTPTPTPTATPVPAQSQLSVGSQQGVVGSTVGMEISLIDVGNSLSGFLVTVTVEDGAVAQIVAVEFPDYSDPAAGIQLTGILESLPAPSVTIAAVDLGGVTLQGPIDDVVIATVVVELLASGSTEVSVVAPPRIDDDQGNPVSVALMSGTLDVDP